MYFLTANVIMLRAYALAALILIPPAVCAMSVSQLLFIGAVFICLRLMSKSGRFF